MNEILTVQDFKRHCVASKDVERHIPRPTHSSTQPMTTRSSGLCALYGTVLCLWDLHQRHLGSFGWWTPWPRGLAVWYWVVYTITVGYCKGWIFGLLLCYLTIVRSTTRTDKDVIFPELTQCFDSPCVYQFACNSPEFPFPEAEFRFPETNGERTTFLS